MRINKILLPLAVFFVPNFLGAALPPLYQSAHEIKAVVSDEKLGQYISSGELILEIRKNEQGYEITTSSQTIEALVIYKPVQQPGPVPFEIKYQKTDKPK